VRPLPHPVISAIKEPVSPRGYSGVYRAYSSICCSPHSLWLECRRRRPVVVVGGISPYSWLFECPPYLRERADDPHEIHTYRVDPERNRFSDSRCSCLHTKRGAWNARVYGMPTCGRDVWRATTTVTTTTSSGRTYVNRLAWGEPAGCRTIPTHYARSTLSAYSRTCIIYVYASERTFFSSLLHSYYIYCKLKYL